MEVMGIKILVRSVSTRISPGSFPNQFISQGAKCSINPITINMMPAVMINRAIVAFILTMLGL